MEILHLWVIVHTIVSHLRMQARVCYARNRPLTEPATRALDYGPLVEILHSRPVSQQIDENRVLAIRITRYWIAPGI